MIPAYILYGIGWGFPYPIVLYRPHRKQPPMKDWKLQLRLGAAAFVAGVVIALVLKAFEAVAVDGTLFLWNDVLKTDQYPWLNIVWGAVVGLGFRAVLVWRDRPQLNPPEGKPSGNPVQLANILLAGAASLLAGASLGPEKPLTEASEEIGAWSARKLRLGPYGPILVVASAGGLMVAFLGSYLLVLLPFLILYQRAKRIPVASVLPVLLAGAGAILVVYILERSAERSGSLPVSQAAVAKDYLTALTVGVGAAVVAMLLVRCVGLVGVLASGLLRHVRWWQFGLASGLVLGMLYWIGGESVRFSGSEGTKLLLHDHSNDSIWILLGLLAVKLLATGWSEGTGYRGGRVFPSIYMGMALALLVIRLDAGWAGPGVIIGAVAGVFAATLGSPVVGLLAVGAIIPAKLLGVALVAAIPAGVVARALTPPSPEASA